jgi:hypothetical protein
MGIMRNPATRYSTTQNALRTPENTHTHTRERERARAQHALTYSSGGSECVQATDGEAGSVILNRVALENVTVGHSERIGNTLRINPESIQNGLGPQDGGRMHSETTGERTQNRDSEQTQK